ncbi:MAG: thioredoxin fold domain-containing protein [Campylobacter sp.]|nr:thioredoxin fold domain-containing protein [Campylobacter sp.]MBQ9875606.1 thioredoxin fold domain-containing protein [Campylobacter sp.]MBR2156719.1 thioredoxin fold domain-containing protein [Campylobacter sp.]MBR4141049.1 thioredoxin fold domain-containing protein [Campylobacter sp.]
MKKTILTSALAVATLTSLNAATDEQILSVYGGAPQGIDIKIAERIPVEGLDGFEAVILKITQGGYSQEEIIMTKGDLVFPDVFNVKEKINYKEGIKEKRLAVNLSKVYKEEKAENIIKLGNDASKPTMIIFTDAECPYCRQEMDKIEERLKFYNIEIIMTSVHGNSGHSKSYMIYKDIKTAKTDADKIKVLRKYYDKELPSQEKEAGEANVAKMQALAAKYHAAGVNSVPYRFEKDRLVK